MRQNRTALFLASALALVLSAPTVWPKVQIKNREFQPGLANRATRAKSRLLSRSHLVLDFATPPTAETVRQMASRGMLVVSYLPTTGVIVRIDGEPNLAGLDLMGFDTLQPEDKLSAELALGASESRQGSTLKPGQSFYVVEFHADIPLEDRSSLVTENGVEIRKHHDLIGDHMLVRGTLEQMRALTEWDEVAYIFPASDELASGLRVVGCLGGSTIAGRIGQLTRSLGLGADGPSAQSSVKRYLLQGVLPKGIPEAQVLAEITRAMAVWSSAVQIDFQRTMTSSEPKDINIRFTSREHSDSDTVMDSHRRPANAFYHFASDHGSSESDLYLDSDSGGNLGADTDLHSKALHQLGHALGLGHSDNPSSAMYPYYRRVPGLTSEDKAAIQMMYVAVPPVDAKAAAPEPRTAACLPGFCVPTTYTVCKSGCTFSDLQTALNEANRGDTLELKAGEVFEGTFTLPYKPGAGTVTVRTSRWRELPPQGVRITSGDAVLMPKLQPNNSYVPVVRAGYDEQYVSSVSTPADTINFSSPHGFVKGDPVACWSYNGTIPVEENRVYFVRDTTPNSLKLSTLPNGPVLDLVSTPTASMFRCTLARSISGWTFQGIEFRTKPGQKTQYNLLQIGTGQATSRAGFATNFIFDRVYIHGHENEEGPNVCLFLEARALTVADSRIEFCKLGGYESKGISMPEVVGPAIIRNNYIEAAAINALVGGDYVRVRRMVSGDEGGILFEGNHFFKPMSYKWSSGTGGATNPAGSCADGSKYLNTATGVWFHCSGSTWSQGPTCANGEYFKMTNAPQSCANGACWSCTSGMFARSGVYRPYSYAVKNLFEIKSGTGITVRGNVFENNWIDGQDGIAVWIISVGDGNNTAGWARGEKIRFERNIVRNSSQGIRIASTNSPLMGMRNNRIDVIDNLVYNIGKTDYPSINAASARPLSFGGPCDDCVVDHNTILSGVSGGQGIYFDTAPFVRPRLSNSILNANLYGMFGDGGRPISYFWGGDGNVLNTVMVDNLNNQGAPASFGSYAKNGKYIRTTTALFNGPGDYRLSPTSPYSAACKVACDYSATDGKDLGADIDAVESATAGVTGSGSVLSRMGVQVEAGSRHAIVRYQPPTSAACALLLFTNAGRTIIHGDTFDAAKQTDRRVGNLVGAATREFVLGTSVPLTPSKPYYARLDCGTLRIPVSFVTASAGATMQHGLRLAVPTVVRYANSPSLAGAVTLAPSTRPVIPIPSGTVVYVQIGSLPTYAVAGR